MKHSFSRSLGLDRVSGSSPNDSRLKTFVKLKNVGVLYPGEQPESVFWVIVDSVAIGAVEKPNAFTFLLLCPEKTLFKLVIFLTRLFTCIFATFKKELREMVRAK